ncbi:MAG TPA: gliding motility-associated C-terminal domain-containing protein [Bacteroidia bacterium]|nr:gliding motility-associated C-terminal domain-containing protein [Bacteroidia bacterium]
MKSIQKLFFLTILFFLISFGIRAQGSLTANAGPTAYTCPGSSAVLGGTPSASGGKVPYTYSWSPASGLSSTQAANPSATITTPTSYTLTVTDSAGTTASSTVYVTFLPIASAHAGPGITFCEGKSGVLGANNPAAGNGLTYTWTPTTALDDPSAASPVASPTVTTTYTVTISESPCQSVTEQVTVTVHQPPPVKAGPWVVINQGEKITLHGTGASVYSWSPSNTITYNGTANPDAQPTQTTLYTVSATDQYGCVNYDTVTVFVRQDAEVVIYNTFSPNGDGNNDLWYIGNIEKFPDCKLDIYNRYGKIVYTKIGYANDWDGTNFGEKLPVATYYYVLDLKNGSKAYRGSITIIR